MNIFQKLKALWALKSAIQTLKEGQVKNGISSTEFWTTNFIPLIASLWLQYSGAIPATLTVKVVLIATLGYTVCRTLLKLVAMLAPYTATTVDDKIAAAGTAILDAAEGAFKPKQ